MTQHELDTLEVGDIVRHHLDSNALVITGRYGKMAIAVREVSVTNPNDRNNHDLS